MGKVSQEHMVSEYIVPCEDVCWNPSRVALCVCGNLGKWLLYVSKRVFVWKKHMISDLFLGPGSGS